jgi:molybdate transport system regulatory protein
MSTHMQPELRVNVLEDNRLVFGDAEMRLLAAIAREGTLTDGAAALGLSYRAAWGKLRAVEASLGTRLLETTVGGSGGGSSRLTPTAQRIVAQYHAFRDAVGIYAQEQFEKHFGEAVSSSKLCLGEADSHSEATTIPAAFLREAVVVSEASGELV